MAMTEDKTLLLEAENGGPEENGDIIYTPTDTDRQLSELVSLDEPSTRRPRFRGTSDLVVAIFVVAFDTRKGKTRPTTSCTTYNSIYMLIEQSM